MRQHASRRPWPLLLRPGIAPSVRNSSNNWRRSVVVVPAAAANAAAAAAGAAARLAAGLPIEPQIAPALASLDAHPSLVLEAPPGAGKTTALPLAILQYDGRYLDPDDDQDGGGGGGAPKRRKTILVVEPRRVAAKAAARRMAAMLGEGPPGSRTCRVGYLVRLERAVGPAARVVCVTEGVLLRRLLKDPSLPGVGCVLFDEYHERSADADTALALCLDSQRGGLRPDLRLVVMSATLGGGLASRLSRMMAAAANDDDTNERQPAPVLTSDGRSFPVKTVYLGSPSMLADGREAASSSNNSGGLFGGLPAIARARPGVVEAAVADAVALALEEDKSGGDVLAFLPGVAHIRRAQRLLAERHGVGRGGRHAGVKVAILHGSLSPAQQDAVLRPSQPQSSSSSPRRVVLATPIAESSVTLDGVTAVVDCGLRRAPRFDPRTGVSRLVTSPISEAAADQRRGRAGRTAPGVCYRLWDSGEELDYDTAPEIREADLAPLALTLSAWGSPFDEEGDDRGGEGGLRWLDPPDGGRLETAFELLRELGAVEGEGEEGGLLAEPPRITPRGRAMAALGAHPRFAQLAIRGAGIGGGGNGNGNGKSSKGLDCPEIACVLASLLGERDVLVAASSSGSGGGAVGASSAARSADLRTRLQALADAAAGSAGAGSLLFQGVPAPRPDEVDRTAAERALEGARQMLDRVRRLELGAGGEDDDEDEEEEAAGAGAAALSAEEEEEEEEGDDEDDDALPRRPRTADNDNTNEEEARRRFHAAWTAQARQRPALVGALVASAFPDRIARVKTQTLNQQRPEVTLASGDAATLPRPAREDSLLEGSPELLAVAELSGGGVAGKTGAQRADVVRLAAPLPMAAVEALLPGDVVEREFVIWAPSAKRVVGKRQTRLGALVLREESLPPDRLTDERCAPVIVAALQKEVLLLIGGSGGSGDASSSGSSGSGSDCNEAGFEAALGLSSSFASWRARCLWLRAAELRASGGSSDLPDLSARALVRSMPRWLAPLLAGCRSRADVSKMSELLASALKALLSPDQQRRVERDAPARAPLPLGGTAAIDYSHPAGPTARARVQEVFGLAETPLLGGRVPLRLELLDPAQRPLAATSDLASFWKTGWPLARKDMRGRYPKHVWPEDGAAAEPTRMTKAKTEAAARAKAEAAEGAGAGAGKKKGGGGGGGGSGKKRR